MAAKRKGSVLLHKETIPTVPTPDAIPDVNPEDPYAGLMKDADKLKLMLLAWNYQNSNAVRNGTEGPDLGVVGGLWAQYQNALAQNVASNKIESSLSPVPRPEESSPMETQDETNSSGQKDEDEASEDDSDDKMDQIAHDPERLKAFNMFVRLFVDENLDRIIPISKQPKEKIQAIIDSCARQFPEFSERSRKRIRTYLKSCRRNKKAREGWDNSSRPTPAHLTSVQAEQILAIACENESMNAKRMRIGLDPITQTIPLGNTSTTATGPSSSTSTSVTSADAANVSAQPFPSSSGSVASYARSTPSNPLSGIVPESSTGDGIGSIPTNSSAIVASSGVGSGGGGIGSARSSPLALNAVSSVGSVIDTKSLVGSMTNGSSGNNLNTMINSNTSSINSSIGVVNSSLLPAASPLYRPTDFTSPTSTSPYGGGPARTPTYPSYFPSVGAIANATPTDLSMKAASSVGASAPTNCTTTTISTSASQQLQQLQQLQQQQQQQHIQQQQQQQQQPTQSTATSSSTLSPSSGIRPPPPLVTHKLSANEISAARQVISSYRESAAFLLRTADQVEQLLVQQQQQQQQQQ